MFRKTLMAIAIAMLTANAQAAVSADEAKQIGTTLTPTGASWRRAASARGERQMLPIQTTRILLNMGKRKKRGKKEGKAPLAPAGLGAPRVT